MQTVLPLNFLICMVSPQKIQGRKRAFLGEKLLMGIITARRVGCFSAGVELMLDMDIPPRSQKSGVRGRRPDDG